MKTICKLLKSNSIIIIDNASYRQEMQKTFLCQSGEKHSFNHGKKKTKYLLNQMLYDQSGGRFAKNIERIKHRQLLTT